MKNFFYKHFKFLLFLAALVTGVTTQAMEFKQEQQYPFLVDTLESAIIHEKNPKLCAKIFNGFSRDIINKEPVEKIGIFVDLIGQAAPRNAQITTIFCSNLAQLCGQHQESATIMRDHMGTLIDTLHKNNNTEALEKLACIFADNTESGEYKAVQNILEEKRQNNTLHIDEDQELAQALEASQYDNTNHNDEEFNVARAIAESLLDNQPKLYPSLETHGIIPNAPPQEEIEDEDYARAVRASLQSAFNNPGLIRTFAGYVAGQAVTMLIDRFTK